MKKHQGWFFSGALFLSSVMLFHPDTSDVKPGRQEIEKDVHYVNISKSLLFYHEATWEPDQGVVDDESTTLAKGLEIERKKGFISRSPDFGVVPGRVWGALYPDSYRGILLPDHLIFNSERVEVVNLVILYKDGSRKFYHYDPSIPFKRRLVPHRKLIFPLEKEDQISKIFFNISSDLLIDGSVYLTDGIGLAESDFFRLLFSGVFYGILISMFLYNLVVLFFIRDQSYLYYILLVLSHILVQFSMDGYMHQLLVQKSYLAARDFRMYVGVGTQILAILFVRKILELKIYLPRFDRFLSWLAKASVILIFIQYIFGTKTSAVVLAYSLVSVSITLLMTGYVLIRKSRIAFFFSIAWTPLILGVAIQEMKMFNLYAPILRSGNYALQLGHILEVLILSFVLGYRIRQMQSMLEKVNGELFKVSLATLKDKLKPHFVLNTLTMILWFIKKDRTLAQKALKNLVHSYRFLLSKSQFEVITLQEEIAFARHYTEVLLYKHSSSLKIDFKIKGDIGDTEIPPLTIQPLVENAYRHGIRRLTRGRIKIDVEVVNGLVTIGVENTASREAISEKAFQETTIGSIKKRLEYLFPGSEFTLKKVRNKTYAKIKYNAKR